MLRSGVITFGLLGRQKTGRVGYKASHDGRREDESSLLIGRSTECYFNQMHSGIFGPPWENGKQQQLPKDLWPSS
ncbi:hypothetical protein QQF64_011575 [Cirrhinus molitorella]|uniref:Uncharacterized protein n=1 Tax=Cirrhinus molitorella TaxID=172907 RepID=A0ABR3M251_9TELE